MRPRDALGRQSVREAHLWPQLGPGQGQPSLSRGFQAGDGKDERGPAAGGWVRAPRSAGCSMAGGRVQGVQPGGLALKPGLVLPQLPPGAPARIPARSSRHGDGGVDAEAGHVVGQQRVGGVEGHEKGWLRLVGDMTGAGRTPARVRGRAG